MFYKNFNIYFIKTFVNKRNMAKLLNVFCVRYLYCLSPKTIRCYAPDTEIINSKFLRIFVLLISFFGARKAEIVQKLDIASCLLFRPSSHDGHDS